MGIDLRRGYIRMAQHDLNRPEVRTPFQEMTGKRVSYTVGRDLFFDACSQSISLDYFPEPLSGKRITLPIQK